MNKVGLVSMFLCAMGSEFIWSEKGRHRKDRGFKIQDKAWGERTAHGYIAPHTVMGALHFGSNSVGLWEAIVYF